jgi:adenosylmethionine-8-amino-7-oxononanoate aminotransferase
MKIAVCIKQVPTREWQPRLRDDKTWIREQDVSYEMNEPDAYALEEALRLREKHGGEVVVCSAGPTRVQQVLREALARGADRALHVEDDSLASADAFVSAGALANLRYLLDHDLQANALAQGDRILSRLRPLAEKLGVVGEVRGKGLMIGVELVGADGASPNAAAAGRVLEHTRRAGLLVGKGGLFGNCLRIAPPLSLTADEAEHGAAILVEALVATDAEEAS